MSTSVNDEMKQAAEYAVKIAKDKLGQVLDYSENSLPILDKLLELASQQYNVQKSLGKVSDNAVNQTSNVWGSYLGEVIRKLRGGEWNIDNNLVRFLTINGIAFFPLTYTHHRITGKTRDSVLQYLGEVIKAPTSQPTYSLPRFNSNVRENPYPFQIGNNNTQKQIHNREQKLISNEPKIKSKKNPLPALLGITLLIGIIVLIIYVINNQNNYSNNNSDSYTFTQPSLYIPPASNSSSSSSSSGTVLGTWVDTNAFLNCTLVIKKIYDSTQSTKYAFDDKCPDGSTGTYDLSPSNVNGEQRLILYGGNLYGDYMVIENNGNLAFYDDQGFIYQDSPSNSSDYQSQSVQSGSDNTSWFSGGTLQQSTVAEWRQASYANRLATSADFIAATQNVDYGNLGQFKQWATDLETCVSTAVSGGDVDNEKVSLIAAMCTVQLFPK